MRRAAQTMSKTFRRIKQLMHNLFSSIARFHRFGRVSGLIFRESVRVALFVGIALQEIPECAASYSGTRKVPLRSRLSCHDPTRKTTRAGSGRRGVAFRSRRYAASE